MKLGVVQHSLGCGEDPLAALDQARALEVRALGISLGPVARDPALLAQVADRAAAYGIELEGGWGDRFIENGATQPVEPFRAFVRTVCRPLGIRVIGTAGGSDRWDRRVRLPEQLARLTAALRPLAAVAAEEGVVLALENHADYRGHEVAAIVAEVGSPGLGVRLDTANPYAVIEEPVAAAEALAPLTVATHVKDLRVRPKQQGLLALVGCALGEGDVDLRAIVGMLAARAPDPARLALTVEVEPPQGTDVWEAARRSVAWMRETFADVLDG
jgi:sugar phosphate isomerase/epimerase